MFSLNPYAIGGGVLATAAIAGTIWFQSGQIHHYHTLYDSSQVQVALKDNTIRNMTTAQNDQLGKSQQNVIKVIQGPKEVQSIIREINAAPAKDCTLIKLPEEVQNAY